MKDWIVGIIVIVNRVLVRGVVQMECVVLEKPVGPIRAMVVMVPSGV